MKTDHVLDAAGGGTIASPKSRFKGVSESGLFRFSGVGFTKRKDRPVLHVSSESGQYTP